MYARLPPAPIRVKDMTSDEYDWSGLALIEGFREQALHNLQRAQREYARKSVEKRDPAEIFPGQMVMMKVQKFKEGLCRKLQAELRVRTK